MQLLNGKPWRIQEGDCRDLLPAVPDASFDAVITDPPYPEIDREYGRMTEADWMKMMKEVVFQCRRVLKPTGSAVFILQPNSERVGRMRTWLWEFMAWVGREWGIVQDAYWWNPTAMPTVHCNRGRGLMRPSVKVCVWVGPSDCWRDQNSILWTQSDANKTVERCDRALQYYPSGLKNRRGRQAAAADERGGTTPFNLIPISNGDSQSSGGANGHGAATPLALCSWWTRYIVPTGGAVLDPFCGSGTVGLAAIQNGCSFLGMEKFPRYIPMAKTRLANHNGLTKDESLPGESLPLFREGF